MTIKKIIFFVLVALSCFVAWGSEKAATHIKGKVDAYVIADGLQGPDGLALHPESREVYLVEEKASRISHLVDGKIRPVIQQQFEVIEDIPEWAFTPKRNRGYWLNNRLQSPEGIAFDKRGHMFVTEDYAGGRILEFIPEPDGSYIKARPVPIPWMEREYAWEAVAVTDDGRLFIAGSTSEFGPGLYFGTVLMRDPAGNWWVVDYGPFASFSALTLSANQEVLVVAEEVSGSIGIWDTVRHAQMGSVPQMLPNTEGLATMPDGTILVVQESGMLLSDQVKGHQKEAMPGRIMQLNPLNQEIDVFAEGFGLLESALVDPETGFVYVTDDQRGELLQLRPIQNETSTTQNVLERMLYTAEISDGSAPKKWPGFLKAFMERMGVQTTNEVAGIKEGIIDRGAKIGSKKKDLTLREFTEEIPVVAGVLTAEPIEVSDPDPVEEVRFLLLYPNDAITENQYATPGLTLLAVKHRSGKIVRTKMLGNFLQSSGRLGDSLSQNGAGTLFVPIGNMNLKGNERSGKIALTFMGIDMMDDYILKLETGLKEGGELLIQPRRTSFSASRDRYALNYIQKNPESGEVERNLVVAGFNRLSINDYGWYKIGNAPVSSLLSQTDARDQWYSRRMEPIAQSLIMQEESVRKALGKYGRNADTQISKKPISKNHISFEPIDVNDRIKGPMAKTPLTRPGEEPARAKSREALPPAEKAKQNEGVPEKRAQQPEIEKPLADRPNAHDRDQEVTENDEPDWNKLIMSRTVEQWQTMEF